MKRVLVIVQNLPVPLDRRVWLECQALRDAGYTVSVICPMGPGDPPLATIDDIEIHKYPAPAAASGFVGYLREFVYCWAATLVRTVRVRRRRGFDVIQACNPPDTYWALALLWRPLGVKFVFDQHDLNPELFRSRFGEPEGRLAKAQLGVLLWLERRTYRAAHHVITVNESYKQVAMRRGALSAADVTVVRSGPDTRRMRPVVPGAPLRGGPRELVYLGIMGPQDGVDILLDAFDVLVHEMGRTDVHLNLLGFGDCLEDLRAQATRLDLNEHVTFTGRVDGPQIAEYLSRAELGLDPDPLNPLNDISTMNKAMEYMAFGLPVVTFDLKETRVSAGDAAVYITPGDLHGFAKAIAALLDDDERRAEMGAYGRRRAVAELDWEPQKRAYVAAFDRLLGTVRPESDPGWPAVDRRRSATGERLVNVWGQELVDLRRAADSTGEQEADDDTP